MKNVRSSFLLWGNCFLVKGYFFSIIVDCQKSQFIRIPNNFVQDFNLEKLDAKIQPELKELGYGFYTNTPNKFPKLNFNYIEPYDLKNLEITIEHCNFFSHKIKLINDIIVEKLSLIFEEKINLINWKTIRKMIESFKFDSVDLIFLHENINVKNCIETLNISDKVKTVYCHLDGLKDKLNKIEYIDIKNKIEQEFHFHVNLDVFAKSEFSNAYYNKRLHLTTSGYYFDSNNKKSKIIESSYHELVSNLQILWNASKSKTLICKNCEFYRICFDKMQPIYLPELNQFKRVECKYNPYIGRWKGEEGYKTLSECGVISNETGFSIDHEKIAKINAELWPDE